MRARLALGLVLALGLAGCTAPGTPPEGPLPSDEEASAPGEPREPIRRARPLVTELMPDFEGLGGYGHDAASSSDAPADPSPGSAAPPGPTPPGRPAPTTPPPADPQDGPAPQAPSRQPSTPSAAGAAPSGPPAPMVTFRAGADARSGPWVTGFQVAPDGGSFSAGLRGVAGARVHVDSLALLTNAKDAPREVHLSSEPVRSPLVLEARLTFRAADGSPLGTLDLLAPEPSLSFALAAGGLAEASWTLTLAEGAGPEAAFQRTVQLVAAG